MKKKDQILEEALIMFSQNGYYGMSLSTLANKVGMKKPSIYNYFSSKDELYSLCIDKCMSRGILNLENIDVTNNREKLLYFSKKYIFDDIKYISFYFQMQSAPVIHQKKIKNLNVIKQEIIENKIGEFLGIDSYKEEQIIHIRTFYNGWLVRRYFSENSELLNIALEEFEKDFNFLFDNIIPEQ